MTSLDSDRHAHVIGLGLIGASIAVALQRTGWQVTGFDVDDQVLMDAQRRGFVKLGSVEPTTQLVVVAVPAGVVVEAVSAVMSSCGPDTVITDVAGVKSSIAHLIEDDRFIPGHPMAGSERRGLDGARHDLFEGCNWILTPRHGIAMNGYVILHGILRELGANVVALSPEDHDRLVAVASHVPHVVAGSLMNVATDVASADAVLLQLAAGGFRDMTRIAAGDPAIWPDVLLENKEAIQSTLDLVDVKLQLMREALDRGDRATITLLLQQAADARRQLPGRALRSEEMVRIRVNVDDRPGSLATITTLASDRLINLYDLEISHAIEGRSGALLLTVDAAKADELESALIALDFRVGRG
jgi:prephenate dehydrogenase